MKIITKFPVQYKYYLKNKCTPEYIKRQSDYRLKMRGVVLDVAGGRKCIKCGFEDCRALQIDHVNGGGRKERKVSLKLYSEKIRKNPTQYQVLCANCNSIKRHENKEFNFEVKRGNGKMRVTMKS